PLRPLPATDPTGLCTRGAPDAAVRPSRDGHAGRHIRRRRRRRARRDGDGELRHHQRNDTKAPLLAGCLADHGAGSTPCCAKVVTSLPLTENPDFCKEIAMPSRELSFPVFDADNHMYEPQEALTKFLPDKRKHVIDYVQVRGRTKIVVRGHIS